VLLLQRILLIFGLPALGLVVGTLGTVTVLALFFRPQPGQDPSLGWGGAGLLLFLGIVGAFVGAIVGLRAAFRGIDHWVSSKPWPLATWVGIAMGLGVALIILFTNVFGNQVQGEVIRWWPGTLLWLTAGAAAGGLLGSAAGRRGVGVPDGHRKKIKRARSKTV
jgi:hypothetical protein